MMTSCRLGQTCAQAVSVGGMAYLSTILPPPAALSRAHKAPPGTSRPPEPPAAAYRRQAVQVWPGPGPGAWAGTGRQAQQNQWWRVGLLLRAGCWVLHAALRRLLLRENMRAACVSWQMMQAGL